jgi:hypothetical protein
MKTVAVQVQGDHLANLAHARSPIAAVTELVWNGLDADATEVRVTLVPAPLGGLQAIRVGDNGHGLSYEDAIPAFQNLGGSWKRGKIRTQKGRLLHGRLGKGRFRAFALGGHVVWTTRFKGQEGLLEYSISGDYSNLQVFHVADPAVPTSARSGTDVEISNLHKDFRSLSGEKALQAMAEHFALYLRQYPNVHIFYENERVDPGMVEDRLTDYQLSPILIDDGRSVTIALTIIEWRVPTERALYLCDAQGFTLAEVPAGIQAPGFDFTAYLKSDFLRDLDTEGALVLEELHPELKKLLGAAKEKMREHFRELASEATVNLVEEWKREDVYPYTGNPQGLLEVAERQVFDVVALNVNEYLPDFDSATPKAKRLAFRLLREALESSPSAVHRIIQDVLELPKEKQAELLELLEKTSLEAIINSAKVVADRLNFLRGLETLVFDPVSKGQLLERRQLHRILSEHTWLFGEHFNLTINDETLTTVLRRHVDSLGIELVDMAPVVREDGSEGIVDLMFSRRVPTARSEEREHLVVELKRPSVKIGDKEVAQVRSYAFAIAEDDRFRDTGTRWTFWAVSNEISDSVRRETRQAKRPEGLLYDDPDARVFIWVKTWGQIIQEGRGRLRFFEEHLQYQPDAKSSLEYLQRMHDKYLPKSLREEPS